MEWKNKLFRPSETVGFKAATDDPNVYRFERPETEFYIVNPIKTVNAPRPASADNIAAYRNIVVEIDSMPTQEEQFDFISKNEMPFTIAVSSANKSVHFIMSLTEDLASGEDYGILVRMIYAAMGGVPDPKCVNVNRLTRTPGALRADTGKIQALLEVRESVENGQLYHWLYYGPSRKKVTKFLEEQERRKEERELQKERVEVEGKRAIPNIYRDIITGGALHPETNSRHDSLVKLGIWLKHNGYDENELADLMYQAEASLAIPAERRDAQGIIRWLYGV